MWSNWFARSNNLNYEMWALKDKNVSSYEKYHKVPIYTGIYWYRKSYVCKCKWRLLISLCITFSATRKKKQKKPQALMIFWFLDVSNKPLFTFLAKNVPIHTVLCHDAYNNIIKSCQNHVHLFWIDLDILTSLTGPFTLKVLWKVQVAKYHLQKCHYEGLFSH